MEIRRADIAEIDYIMTIFERAKLYMYSQGNTLQWGDDYPPRALIIEEIAAGHFYCIEHDGIVGGVFSFVAGTDIEPTYDVVEDGAWRYDEPYGVVHRLASNGLLRDVADCCFEWCKERQPYLRVDTHRDNATMIRAIERQGFVRSGIITLSRNGDKRIAYEWHA